MAEFADMLSLHLRRPVLNETNLRGLFRVKLDWSSDADPLRVSKLASDPEKHRPALSQALEEQLGLRLTAGQSHVEIIVVERAEKPRSN